MTKYIVAAFGGVFILVGGIDWAVGALVPHSHVILVIGAVAIVAAGFIHWWQKLQNPKWPLLMGLAIAIFGTTDVCAAGPHDWVLTPPAVTPMIKRSLISGSEHWVWVLVFVVIGLTCLLVQKFLRGCDHRNRPRCNYPQRQ